MPKFLIDVNLPYRFQFWNSADFIHQRDLDDEWTDTQIWDYAKRNNLTIISKDFDFYERILLRQPPPRVIHLRIGNMKFRAFREFIGSNWSQIEELIVHHKLIIVFSDRFELVK